MAFSVFSSFCRLLFLLISLLYYTGAVEELVISHAPASIRFVSSEPVRSSFLGDIFSTFFGYTIRSNVEWPSMVEIAPWKRPEALAVIEILGFDNNIDMPLQGNKFMLENLGDMDNQYDLTAHRTNERYFGKGPIMLHMHLSDELHDSKIAQPVLLKSVPADPKKRLQLALDDPDLGQLIQNSIFNMTHPSDVKFLTEIATMNEFLKAISAHKSEIRDGTPDIYWFKISGFEPIVSHYGQDSIQFREAIRLMGHICQKTESTLRHIYDDNVVIAIIKASPTTMPLSRKGRSLLAESSTAEPPQEKNPYNLTPVYDSMFPVVFAILLFVGVMLVISLMGVSMALANMDPGKDSIIYRMTSQRMKKD